MKTLFVLPLFPLIILGNDVQLQKLQEEIVTINKKLDKLYESKNSLKLKDNKTVLTVGGRIQLSMSYASPQTTFFVNNVSLDTHNDNGLLMSARDSRFWIKTKTPSEYGFVRSIIEFDFLAKSEGNEKVTNSYEPRIRHAYVEFDGFTIGQANSAFNSDAPLDTIYFSFNYAFARQPLIRYKINQNHFSYTISFEQPETTLLNQDATLITPKDDVMPDTILKAQYFSGWGEASLALMGRYINQNNYVESTRDSKLSYSGNFSTLIKVFELDDIRLDAQYGLGLGRYLAFNPYPSGTIDSHGKIQLQPSYGGHIGYRHWWEKNIKSTLGYSYSATKNNVEILNNTEKYQANKSASSLQANLFYSPIKNILTGFEYSYGTREVENSQTGYLNILSFIFRYDF